MGKGELAYRVFLPNPLPPEDLDLPGELWGVFERATFALGELSGLGRSMPSPQLFIRPFIRKEAVLSSMIEGTQTELGQLMALEAQQRAKHGEARLDPDAREVLNYVIALEYGLERIKALPMSLRLLRELHERLVDGVRGQYAAPGEFRITQNWIGPPGCTLNEAIYVPPDVESMDDALAKFEEYLHSGNGLPRLIKLGLIHYQFEAIHPFVDGNGRIGRLLLTLLICDWKLLPLPLLYLSAFFERNRGEYYRLLLQVSQRGNWSDWLSFFLEGVRVQAEDAAGRARGLLDLQQEYHQTVATAGQSVALLRIVDYLFESPIVSIPEIQRMLGCTYQAAKYSVDKLVSAGVLTEMVLGTRPKLFFANQILQIVS